MIRLDLIRTSQEHKVRKEPPQLQALPSQNLTPLPYVERDRSVLNKIGKRVLIRSEPLQLVVIGTTC